MKIKLLFTILIFTFLSACKSERKEPSTIVSGVFPGLKNESITLVPVQDYFPRLNLPDSYPTTETDSSGNYDFNINELEPDFYQIVRKNYHVLKADIYIEPGDSLFITQLSKNDSSVFQITGKGSEKHKHLERDYSIFPKDPSFYNKIRSNSFSTEIDFKNFIDSLYEERINILDSSNIKPELLKTYHRNTIEAERARFLLDHLERRSYYMNEGFQYFYPDSGYIRFLDNIEFNNSFSQTVAARMLTSSYLNYFARIAYQSKTHEEWWKENLGFKFEMISDKPKSLWRDLLALGTTSEYSFGMSGDDFFEQLEQFTSNMRDNFYHPNNQLLFEKNIASYVSLAPGNPAPDFELPDSSGNIVRLSDFRGTIVYIDFWGTWCYPCIQEIPEALKLQEKYKNKPVTFLYVGMEYDSTNIAEWKEFIAGNNERFGHFLDNKPFPGIHLVAEKQLNNENIKDYKLNFAPTHILIDDKGNIVHPRAKRSNEIHEDIDKLLEQL